MKLSALTSYLRWAAKGSLVLYFPLYILLGYLAPTVWIILFGTPWVFLFLCIVVLLPDSRYFSKSITRWKLLLGALVILLYVPSLLIFTALGGDHSSSGLGDITILLVPLYFFGELAFIAGLIGLVVTEVKSANARAR